MKSCLGCLGLLAVLVVVGVLIAEAIYQFLHLLGVV